MRLYEVAAALIVSVAAVAFIRIQYDAIVAKVTSGDPQYQVMPVATPIYKQICGNTSDADCLIPTVGPLFPDSKQPSRGLSVP